MIAGVWLAFLSNAQGPQLCRPFADYDLTVVPTVLRFASDASLSAKLGFGATFEDQWLFGQWDPNFIKSCKPSIEFLELFALTIALTAWGNDPKLKNTRIAIFCDNEVVLHMVNSFASTCTQCMKLIQFIALQGIHFNHGVSVRFVRFVRSKQNVLPDALSRMDFKRFWTNAPKSMNPLPTKLPEQLWPIQKIWSQHFNILNFRIF